MVNYVGRQLGNYRVTRLLAEGGFAQVYLAEHLHLGTVAAIKVLLGLSDQEKLKFRDEARTVARLIHPNIIRLLEFGIEGNTPFMVMDYAPGGTLKDRHLTGTALPLPTILSYVNQIADGLQYAHSEKIIHRDIKPENILIGRRNEILLSDFGIAVIAHNTRSQKAEEVIGTWLYTAPEQFKGKPQPASDQYALGVIVYRWLCGFPPFQGSIAELYNQHLSASPPSLHAKNPTIPPVVEQVVLMALAKDPQQRFASVQEFAQALEQAYQSQQPTILPTPPIAFPPQVPPPVPAVASSPTHGKLLCTYHGHTNSVVALVWSFDGRYITTKDIDQKVQVWEVTTGEQVSIYQKHPPHNRSSFFNLLHRQTTNTSVSNVTAMQWSPCEHFIAIGKADGTIQVWNVGTGTKVIDYRQHIGTNHLTWSPVGKHIASDGERVFPYASDKTRFYHQPVHEVWNATTGERLFTCDYSGLYHVAWSPDGQRVALTSIHQTVDSVTSTLRRKQLHD